MKRVEKGSDKALGCTLKKLGLKTCKVAGWIFGVLLLCLVSACSCLVEHSAEQPEILVAPESELRLRGHVEQLCAQPRYGDTLEQARLYIEKKLAAAGWAVTLQEFTTSDGETHHNICALRRGRSGKRLCSAFVSAGLKDRFGTKCASMISTWSHLAPSALVRSISSWKCI